MLFLLTGMCYAGKTTTGKLLGKELGIPAFDFSDLFKDIYGTTEIEYLNRFGQANFAEAEKRVLQKDYKDMVISLSGSCLYYTQEMTNLTRRPDTLVLFLHTPLSVIKERMEKDKNPRPILYPRPGMTFDELYYERFKIYAEYAHSFINIERSHAPSNVVSIIKSTLTAHKAI